ncbi:VCBS repeat-containing protein [Streptomyces sp. NPDC097619]|uniref:VCBS repeat-containing protein n=1 Tax=Streptomyces sp. NPDC097619 TaxID=3157228 RepID=UPI00332CE345
MRRIVGAGVAAVLLATGGVVGTGAGTAVAAGDPTFEFSPLVDKAVMPGEGWADLGPSSTGGQHDGRGDGTYVYALSKKPLTEAGWSGGGLPAGFKLDLSSSETCKAKAGVAGILLCDVKDNNPSPTLAATSTAANGLTAYYGLVYVPRGGDVNKGIKEAQTAATQPVGTRRSHATVTAKTRAHVAQNTMKPATAPLPAGGTVTHTVQLHAVDKGNLGISFPPAPGQRRWDEGELKVEVLSVTSNGGANLECDNSLGEIGWGNEARCLVKKPGDYTVSYTLKAAPNSPAWRLRAEMTYEVYSFGTYNPQAHADFAVSSPVPVVPRYRLLARDAAGDLWDHQGTGKGSRVLEAMGPVGWSGDWNRYSALTRLGPVTVQSTGPGAVARDKAGVLWFHGMSGDGGVYTAGKRIGAGWNAFNALVGASDLTGDGKADLLARDTGGVLWVYPGTGNTAAPFGTKTRIGAGWGGFGALVGGVDLTGDKKADLLARDASGVLWLYPGTGTQAKPFGARVQVGTGWGIYNSVVAPGDLDSDGKADFVARDASGVLWWYRGTGDAAKPYAARVKVGGGWKPYNLLF